MECLEKLRDPPISTQTKIIMHETMDYPAITFCYKNADDQGYDEKMLYVSEAEKRIAWVVITLMVCYYYCMFLLHELSTSTFAATGSTSLQAWTSIRFGETFPLERSTSPPSGSTQPISNYHDEVKNIWQTLTNASTPDFCCTDEFFLREMGFEESLYNSVAGKYTPKALQKEKIMWPTVYESCSYEKLDRPELSVTNGARPEPSKRRLERLEVDWNIKIWRKITNWRLHSDATYSYFMHFRFSRILSSSEETFGGKESLDDDRQDEQGPWGQSHAERTQSKIAPKICPLPDHQPATPPYDGRPPDMPGESRVHAYVTSLNGINESPRGCSRLRSVCCHCSNNALTSSRNHWGDALLSRTRSLQYVSAAQDRRQALAWWGARLQILLQARESLTASDASSASSTTSTGTIPARPVKTSGCCPEAWTSSYTTQTSGGLVGSDQALLLTKTS